MILPLLPTKCGIKTCKFFVSTCVPVTNFNDSLFDFYYVHLFILSVIESHSKPGSEISCAKERNGVQFFSCVLSRESVYEKL